MVRKLFGILLAMVIALIVIGFMLPASVTIERTRVIDHSREVVFEALRDFRHFTQWAPWLARQPEMSWRLEGPPQGVGAALAWKETPEANESRMWIVNVDDPRRIDMKLELSGNEADSWFGVAEGQGGVEVTWGMRIEFGALDLVGRYVGLILPGLVGSDYREGLERLDEYLSRSPGRVPELPEDLDTDAGE
ncbi:MULTISPECIES: SRPBCC family protein [unclassified Wenzhouxiangella]|uniref:SRPBCC family protein n=1 Tax=unclassified Wenzhouxiangella TaxID=2613841 RepID=UPI0015F2640D|nr:MULTISPECIES: SRPBCC family protein [unclassified Wenzhouxiangella]